jgi:hypothetical protein
VEQMSLLAPMDYSSRVRAVLSEIVVALGGLEPAAKICRCAQTLLSESLKDTGADKSKFCRVEWIGALMDKAPTYLAMKLRRELVGDGYDVVTATALEVRLARLEDAVRRKYGPSGEETIQEAR